MAALHHRRCRFRSRAVPDIVIQRSECEARLVKICKEAEIEAAKDHLPVLYPSPTKKTLISTSSNTPLLLPIRTGSQPPAVSASASLSPFSSRPLQPLQAPAPLPLHPLLRLALRVRAPTQTSVAVYYQGCVGAGPCEQRRLGVPWALPSSEASGTRRS